VRLSALTAYHDAGIRGIPDALLRELIKLLEKRGRVVISSEAPLREEFKKHQVPATVSDIHHLLYYAELFIGDSQSMAVEAAVLGTPSLRFSDFAGRIGVLEELERTYGLTYGIPSDEPGRLLERVRDLLDMPDRGTVFATRRDRMLGDKIDVTAFLTWLIANYPGSVETWRQQPLAHWGIGEIAQEIPVDPAASVSL
jgi:uncharacterized protein